MRSHVRSFMVSLGAIAWIGGGLPLLVFGQMGQMAEPTEHGTKTVGGLEITLLTAPPLAQAQMAKMMPGMSEMKGMGRMGGMQQAPSMAAMGGQPTHWIGVVVRDLKDDRVMPGLEITLIAQKGGWTRNVTLMPMPGSYGSNITLLSRASYEIRARISPPGRPPVEAGFDLEYR